ncbi:MAG TPA: zinc-dependent alcohol dehydrogenase [Fimbriimonadaceae bacterium]|nr:zinc-dependent alcohol dehydrogenase [Fimbriimonadaceae bacterium]
MKAVCWNAKHDVRVEEVPDPNIINPRDAIVRVTSTAICGSDLHLYNGYIPMMKSGDILGHEFMGEIVDVGPDVQNLKAGDRVVVPFTIACGGCTFCHEGLYASCDNSNPNAGVAEKLYGASPSGIYGYSHLYGGYAGGQAEYARVPYADSSLFKVPQDLPDEQLLFLTDVFPTGFQAVKQANIKRGDVVAIWGCGPVGQFAIRSAFLLGAGTVYAIDRYPDRLKLAEEGGADTINFEEVDVVNALIEITGGRGPDACIDCVGTEALGHGFGAFFDWAKQLARLQTDRPNVLRQAIQACRKGGTVSIPGVYGGIIDGLNFGSAFSKGLTFKMGQTHVQKYLPALLEHIQQGEIDPSFVISHRLPLDEAPEAYELFKHKQDGCTKVVLQPMAA